MVHYRNNSTLENDPSIKYGKFLAHPLPGEEIVISGISGEFPLASNIEEFKNNLYNKVNMVSHIPNGDHPELPSGLGKLRDKDISKFDTGFFGVHKLRAVTMAQICKILLEKCIECIIDAGIHISDMEGSRTGVFLGMCFTENEVYWCGNELIKNGDPIYGNMKSMIANRISYFLKLTGPSLVSDTACSSTLYSLNDAYRAIRCGEIEQAIVCGGNVLFADGATLQFARLGVLSKEGIVRAFDENAKGYVRAEAMSAILIQKAKNCNRLYAKVLHIKTNCDGYKEEGITYPSGDTQLNLLNEIYLESGINPKDMSFIEAHGTGTQVGDPEELNCIEAFFTKGRTTPLLIGSVKSSIGHSEPVSGLCSIIKAILAFETNVISPNINFETPRKTCLGLRDGRMKVVVEKTPLQDDHGLIGVSNFGFGGANAHVILKWNNKEKSGNPKLIDNLPRIICVSGRTEEAVNCLLNDVAEKFDSEHIGLIHNAFRKPIQNHLYRGYTIVSQMGVLRQSVKPFNPTKGSLHIYFGGLLKSYGNLAQELLRLPTFSDFKNRIDLCLIKKKLNLDVILNNSVASNLNHLLAGTITQLCLAELFIQLELEFKGASCYSYGKFTSAYFENSLTLEDVLECLYVIGTAANDKITENGNEVNDNIFTKYKGKIFMQLKESLKCPKQVTEKIGTEVERASPEFFLETMFQDTGNGTDKIIQNSVVLEIGQSPSSFRKKRYNVVTFDVNGGFQDVLKVIGSLYEYGMQPQVQKLYPNVHFPVSRGTPMISPKIKWKHDYEYFVPTFEVKKAADEAIRFLFTFDDEKWTDLCGHVIDGRNLFPATGYLYLVWFLMSEMQSIDINQLKVVFENCKFQRACILPNKSTDPKLELYVTIQRTSGKFEITEGDVTVATGQIKLDQNLSMLDFGFSDNDSVFNYDILTKKEIYKELRLRGYNYKGLFKCLTHFNPKTTSGKIRWSKNWIAFMDNMLQLQILVEDTRLLYVPISIARLTIDPSVHLEMMESLKSGEDKTVDVPVTYSPRTRSTRSGGIEIRGLIASSIPRKKYTVLPVLEKYVFVPNEAKLSLEQSVRIFMQIALENNCGLKVKVAELLDEVGKRNENLLGPIIQDVLGDQPLVQSDITILSNENLDLNLSIEVENKNPSSESEYNLVVGSELLTRNEVLQEVVNATIDSGYILSREKLCISNSIANPNLIILNISETGTEKLVFLKKRNENGIAEPKIYINVSTMNKTFDWLGKLKDAVRKQCDVIAWCQNEPLNGVIGLVNCIRREPGCQRVRSLFIVDQAPSFDPTHTFYKEQLDKNMGVNIYQNGKWGTYRHLLLDDLQEVEAEHCYVNSTVRGDLSSIKWIEGPLTQNTQLELDETLVDVYYSSLNFRDVMTASGRINVDVITRDRREQECVQGFEFSGKTKSGRRVMGMVSQGALATLVKADNNLLWEVPKNWSLKEAATVPVVYGTCMYALIVIGKIKPSDSVLIHSGTGGIGQAAINLCLNMGCTVFTTVGTDEKRKFIQNNFPKINERHIGNSRDLSFEQMIMRETHGHGVDIILNSLAEEKLFASVRCLAANGRFLEIGKFDLANDNRLNLLPLREGASYHGVMLDRLFNESSYVKTNLNILVQKYVDSGAIQPLMMNVFEKNKVEQAFRFMAAGKHMGKVLVEIRQEDEKNVEQKFTFKGSPRYFCNPEKSYIICGGLGGFGLELADWLILRGAKNLILTSRKGITTGYQRYRISIWKNYYCNVKISTEEITSKSGCINLVKEANDLAPVDAIFNLAVVLEDAILENQTEQSFETSFGPKAYATEYLDEVTRKMCPKLRDFVVFSSVSCGRGNAGQSNYGMSNSVMERICEKRRKDGYPALAVEWGAVGDVGLLAELQEDHIEVEISGTLQQSISNCLQFMDILLRQREASIVSSMVVAEKRTHSTSGNIEEVIGGILGIRDTKSVSLHSTLPELGMDSMTGTEIKQVLEREYNIFLTTSELRSITMARIKDLLEDSMKETYTKQSLDDLFNLSTAITNNTKFIQADSPVSKLSTTSTGESVKNLPQIIAIPGVEGFCDILENLTQNLKADVYGINYCLLEQRDTISQMADTLLPYIKDLLQPNKPFHLIAHSVGSIIALEIVGKLENLGYLGTVTLLDGSPPLISKIINASMLAERDSSDSKLQDMLIASGLRLLLNSIELATTMKDIYNCSTLHEKIQIMTTRVNFEKTICVEDLVHMVVVLEKRLNACLSYTPTFEKLKSKVRLFKPTIVTVSMDTEDYDLGLYCENPIEIKTFEGTHTSFLKNVELAEDIMKNISMCYDSAN